MEVYYISNGSAPFHVPVKFAMWIFPDMHVELPGHGPMWATGETNTTAPAVLLRCNPGEFLYSLFGWCAKCPASRVSTRMEETECYWCEAGSYSNPALTKCLLCQEGRVMKDRGGSSEDYGEVKCVEPGKYAESVGLAICANCPISEHARESATGCEKCPPGMAT